MVSPKTDLDLAGIDAGIKEDINGEDQTSRREVVVDAEPVTGRLSVDDNKSQKEDKAEEGEEAVNPPAEAVEVPEVHVEQARSNQIGDTRDTSNLYESGIHPEG